MSCAYPRGGMRPNPPPIGNVAGGRETGKQAFMVTAAGGTHLSECLIIHTAAPSSCPRDVAGVRGGQTFVELQKPWWVFSKVLALSTISIHGKFQDTSTQSKVP